jgi:RHS repeat-associated protein
VDSTGTKTYKRDGAYVTDPVLSDSAASYTPGISERRSSTTKFYHTDRLGTTERLTNTSQTTKDTREYDAFGLLVSSSGSTPTPFGFAGAWGYQEDPDSGLKLLGHRYYDPSTGRFLTGDPIQDGRNWYSYCDSNSQAYVDPAGLQKQDKYIDVGGGYRIRVDMNQHPAPNAHLISPKGRPTMILANGNIPETHGGHYNPPLSGSEKRLLKKWGGMGKLVDDMLRKSAGSAAKDVAKGVGRFIGKNFTGSAGALLIAQLSFDTLCNWWSGAFNEARDNKHEKWNRIYRLFEKELSYLP